MYTDNLEYTEEEREFKERELQKGLEDFKKINQHDLFNRKQVIEVNKTEVEFSKFDSIFTISKSQVENQSKEQLALLLGKNVGKECFCC